MSTPLPTRAGVGPSVISLPPGDWPTIAEFLVQRFPAVPAGVWAARIAGGEVVDERGVPVTAGRCYQPQLKVHYYRSVAAEPALACVPAHGETVLFQDDQLLVVDKPHFMAVTPGGHHLQHTLLVRLKRALGIDTLQPLHRLDRETAGLVMLSVDPATRGRWQALFRERRVAKAYEAIVHVPGDGAAMLPLTRSSRIERDPAHFLRMREVAGEPNAETRIDSIERHGGRARLRLLPLTGRTHQLRVHCAAIGMPIAGDTIYPVLLPAGSDDAARPLQLLARSLAFTDPLTGAARRFDSTLSLGPLVALDPVTAA